MKIHVLPGGDPIHRYCKCLVVPFAGKRRVLSTCPLNGGYREDLSAVFNHDGNPGAGMACEMRAPTYEGHMELIAEEIGLDKTSSAGIYTAASMENVSVRTEKFGELEVTAVVTGGIEANGGRVGDPASWHEEDGAVRQIKPGTINIMLFISTDVTKGCLARALVTCTEAKAAALQELMAPSRYSMGIATGSGTDGTIVVSNAESKTCLTDAGKHSKLGELIGKTVKDAVKEALKRQTGLSPKSQHNLLKRVERFGVTEKSLWEDFVREGGNTSRADFSDRLYHISQKNGLIVYASLYAHLLDQLMWGLITPGEAADMGRRLLLGMKERQDVRGEKPGEAVQKEAECQEKQEVMRRMIRDLKGTINMLL